MTTVLLICDYAIDYLGGAQTALRRQAEALVDSGVDCVVIAPGAPAGWDPRITVIAPPVRFRIAGLGLPVLAPAAALADLIASTVQRFRVTGIVLHSELALAAAALRVGHAAHLPVLHTVHTFFWRAPTALSPLAPLITRIHGAVTGLDTSTTHHGSTPIQNALRGMTLRVALDADAVLSPSAHQAEALRRSGVARVHTLSNVVQPVAPIPPAHGDPLVLLWAARFAPEKRLDVALDAMSRVRERLGPGRVHLHVAGGRRRPRQDVTFHGRVDAEQIDELVRRSSAVIITSCGFDNQPMIALEAFRRGRGVIVSDPVLAQEFGAAAAGTPTPDAEGLAGTIVAVHENRSRLRDAGLAASAYAAERVAAAHVRDLFALFAQPPHHRRKVGSAYGRILGQTQA